MLLPFDGLVLLCNRHCAISGVEPRKPLASPFATLALIFYCCLTSTINHADLRLEICLARCALQLRLWEPTLPRPSHQTIRPFQFFLKNGHSANVGGEELGEVGKGKGVGEEVGKSCTSKHPFPSQLPGEHASQLLLCLPHWYAANISIIGFRRWIGV